MKKQKKSLNLINVFLAKEVKYWKRTMTMKAKLNWFWFIVALLVGGIFHYAFASMHFLFEGFLWIVARSQFKANLKKLYQQATSAELQLAKISDIVIEGIDPRDAPDYCDAFIADADYDGRPATEEELEIMNNDSGFVYESIISKLY